MPDGRQCRRSPSSTVAADEHGTVATSGTVSPAGTCPAPSNVKERTFQDRYEEALAERKIAESQTDIAFIHSPSMSAPAAQSSEKETAKKDPSSSRSEHVVENYPDWSVARIQAELDALYCVHISPP